MILDKTDMLEIGHAQAQMFLSNNTKYCEILVTCSCPRQILLMAYNRLVRLQKLTPLEEMRYEDQKTAGETAKEMANGRLERKALIQMVKALLAIEYFLNL